MKTMKDIWIGAVETLGLETVLVVISFAVLVICAVVVL